jgi:hypothetical protein
LLAGVLSSGKCRTFWRVLRAIAARLFPFLGERQFRECGKHRAPTGCPLAPVGTHDLFTDVMVEKKRTRRALNAI